MIEELRTLAEAEQAYRKAHDLYGGGDIRTGRAWDAMRRAGDNAHTAGNDLRIFIDRQDISHIVAVLSYARAMIDSADLFNPAFEAAIAPENSRVTD